jgi:hypothetical protein
MSKSKLIPLSLVVASRQEAGDMARRRGIQTPKVYKDGDLWKLRVYRDAINAEGQIYRARPEFTIGPATGPGKLSEKQANTVAWESILKHLNSYAAVPQSVVTLEQFVAQKFQPNVIANLKHAGQQHYAYCLKKILPALGEERLRDIDTQRIQNLCMSLLRSGKSVQTATHIKNALSAIFRHAKEKNFFVGENPAQFVKLPEVAAAEKYAYSFEEAQLVLQRLVELRRIKERIMALLSMTTSVTSPKCADCGGSDSTLRTASCNRRGKRSHRVLSSCARISIAANGVRRKPRAGSERWEFRMSWSQS